MRNNKEKFKVRSRRFCAVSTVTILALGLLHPVMAGAQDSVDASETIAVIENLPVETQVVEGADLVARGDELVAELGEDKVTLPVDAGGVISIESSLADVTIGIPGGRSADAEVVDDRVVYDGVSKDTSIVAQASVEGGAQILVTIDSAAAPTEFEFPLTLPDGAHLSLNEDGSASIVQKGAPDTGEVALIETPWALDAAGDQVPTHFLVRGDTLVQVVEHGVDFMYPIVADPQYVTNCGNITCTRYISVATTNSIFKDRFNSTWSGWSVTYGAICLGAALISGPGGVVCGFISLLLIDDLVTNLEYAGKNGKCLLIKYTRIGGLATAFDFSNASPSSNSYCKSR